MKVWLYQNTFTPTAYVNNALKLSCIVLHQYGTGHYVIHRVVRADRRTTEPSCDPDIGGAATDAISFTCFV